MSVSDLRPSDSKQRDRPCFCSRCDTEADDATFCHTCQRPRCDTCTQDYMYQCPVCKVAHFCGVCQLKERGDYGVFPCVYCRRDVCVGCCEGEPSYQEETCLCNDCVPILKEKNLVVDYHLSYVVVPSRKRKAVVCDLFIPV
jgi:hypothetical protein